MPRGLNCLIRSRISSPFLLPWGQQLFANYPLSLSGDSRLHNCSWYFSVRYVCLWHFLAYTLTSLFWWYLETVDMWNNGCRAIWNLSVPSTPNGGTLFEKSEIHVQDKGTVQPWNRQGKDNPLNLDEHVLVSSLPSPAMFPFVEPPPHFIRLSLHPMTL